jgi:hypothetical protein
VASVKHIHGPNLIFQWFAAGGIQYEGQSAHWTGANFIDRDGRSQGGLPLSPGTLPSQVDHRILKAISIEHSKDVDSVVVAVLDEVMPSMTGLTGALSAHHEAMPSGGDSAGNLFANSTREVGSSSSAGHDTHVDEADGSIHSSLHTSSVEVKTGTRENVDNKLYIEDLKMWFQPDHVPIFDVVNANLSSKRKLANSDNEAGYGGYLSSECFSPSSVGAKGGDSMSIKAPQPCKQDADNIITVMDCIPQNNSFKSLNGYVDLNDGEESFLSELLAVAFNNEVFSGTQKMNEILS